MKYDVFTIQAQGYRVPSHLVMCYIWCAVKTRDYRVSLPSTTSFGYYNGNIREVHIIAKGGDGTEVREMEAHTYGRMNGPRVRG